MASITAHADHAPGIRGIRLNWDWVTRPLFGGVLAALVVAAIFGGAPYVALFGAVAGIAGAREWHRMIGEPVFGPLFFMTSAALVAALATAVLWPATATAWAVIAAGAILAALVASFRGAHPVWHGAGALYLGVPMLAVVALRGTPHGAWVIVGMFLAIWATDTGALLIGNLVGGPKLWPALSPNKTWAGTFGGIVTAAVVESVYIAILGGQVVPAALLGAAIAVVSHCGDLFESWVKRVFQRKDSGGMIPGHGGVLDRIDSTLFVAPVLTVVVFATGLNPMFGAHP
jgi:phosphatidate cytidylyltransferase